MRKKIVITSCSQCPHTDHNGGFGKIAYLPVCTKKNRRHLPYEENASRGRVVATPTGVIPEWCPLPDDTEE